MIAAVNSCGCPPRFKSTEVLSRNSEAKKSTRLSKQDAAKCPCPRPGEPNRDSMRGKCSPCCAGGQTESKVVSKIVEGGKPYKEIEAIINDNRMVIRIQRESVESEWEPPCDCVEGKNFDGGKIGGRIGDKENVVFKKVDNFVGRETVRDENCRTVAVYPVAEIVAAAGEINNRPNGEDDEKKDRRDKGGPVKTEIQRVIEREENPNIFVLRIRKRSENSDRKNNIDLEFRTPRPWVNRPKPKPGITVAPRISSTEEKEVEKKSTKGGKKKGKKN